MTHDTATALFIAGPARLDPESAVRYDESLLEDVQVGRRGAVVRVWTNDWCVVLGRNNKPDEWVNESALAADCVPLVRRDSGGGAVIHHPGNVNFSLVAPRAILGGIAPKNAMSVFLAVVIRALAHCNIEAVHTGISDLSVDGRKISGNAERFKTNAVLHHGTLLLASEIERMERYLKTPPNRPGVPHREFVAGLRELGYPIGLGRICEAFARAAVESFGWRLGKLNQDKLEA
jgi:lipoate-protein ligase A